MLNAISGFGCDNLLSMARRKNPAAVALGALGGRKRVPKGLALIDADLQAEIARAGATARWEQYYRDHPEKLKARKEREARKTGKVGRPPKAKGKRKKSVD
jgi:hypothetical protein